jgi:hypothetical protein
MALKGRTSRTILYIAFLALDLSLFTQLFTFSPLRGMAAAADGRYVQPVVNAAPIAEPTTAIVQSVQVDGAFELPVVQQPKKDTNYVSSRNGELTQFAAVSQNGNIGLLAHNYLSGKVFSRLVRGQIVHVLYADGETESFVITEILRYQALDPKSPYSSFQNLDDESEILSVGEMFDRVYAGDHHLTFQTCIAKDGISSWGRLFVMATPKPAAASFETAMLETYLSFRPE